MHRWACIFLLTALAACEGPRVDPTRGSMAECFRGTVARPDAILVDLELESVDGSHVVRFARELPAGQQGPTDEYRLLRFAVASETGESVCVAMAGALEHESTPGNIEDHIVAASNGLRYVVELRRFAERTEPSSLAAYDQDGHAVWGPIDLVASYCSTSATRDQACRMCSDRFCDSQ
ncbi:MAG: hypothetical protein IT378_03710 [Sandaracinaceae bacterium]|nr:hypothetical protein [Sandaracinaceae bacterium]